MAKTSDKDLELWQQWNRSRNPMDLEKLVKQLSPLIHSEVNRRAGTLAREALETRATALAVKAIKSYDPKRNVKLSTHVTNQLQKLSRMNYAHQNTARIPEHRILQYQSVQIAKEDFKDVEGREPTVDELSDQLGWSRKKVVKFNEQFNRNELVESEETAGGEFVFAEHDPRLVYAFYTLSPRQQRIFEYSTGYNNQPELSGREIQKKLGITQGILSYEKVKIRETLKRLLD